MDQVVDLDSPSTWAKVIAERAALFRKVMPEGYAHGHGELVHCTTSRHLMVYTHEVTVINLR
jgi:hypothetical protein